MSGEGRVIRWTSEWRGEKDKREIHRGGSVSGEGGSLVGRGCLHPAITKRPLELLSALACSYPWLTLTCVQQDEEGCRGQEAAPHLPRQVGHRQQGGGGGHEGHRSAFLLPIQGPQGE